MVLASGYDNMSDLESSRYLHYSPVSFTASRHISSDKRNVNVLLVNSSLRRKLSLLLTHIVVAELVIARFIPVLDAYIRPTA